MGSTRRRCKKCNKLCYEGKTEAYGAALGTSRTVGKAVRVYRCPLESRVYHLTTKAR